MSRLLSAAYERLVKSREFKILVTFSAAFALFLVGTEYRDMIKYGKTVETEQLMLDYSVMIGFVIAIFTSIFLAAEYSDGTVRNKIGVGHGRTAIYLSNFIITTVTYLLSYIMVTAIVALIGIPLFGSITIPLTKLLKLLGCIFAAIAAYSSIFLFAAMSIHNRSSMAIVNLIAAFILMAAALTCLSRLQTPKYITTVTVTESGNINEQVENPNYPTDAQRKMYRAILDIDPSGQMYQLAGRTAADLKKLPIYSFGILAVFTVGGVVLFDRKDLK